MNPTGKKKKANQSVFTEIFGGIVGIFLGDASSRIGFATLLLTGGILFLTLPVVELDGTEIKKEITPYVLGSVSILISIILIISWLRKRNRKD
jgi:xanthine/uracil permease